MNSLVAGFIEMEILSLTYWLAEHYKMVPEPSSGRAEVIMRVRQLNKELAALT